MSPYYSQSGITLYHGDNREVLPMLAGAGVDLVFTIPPYNLGNTSGGGFPNRKRQGNYAVDASMASRGGQGKWANAAIADGYETFDDDLPHVDYVSGQRAMLQACWLTLSETGAIYYNNKPRIFNGRLVTPFDYIPTDLPIRQNIIWARAGGMNFSPSFYVPTHEWIVVIAKEAFRLKSKAASGVGDVWYVPQEANPLHPAPFPMTLPSRAIETTSPALVLDPHAGSGTTLVAAKFAGCRAIGIEQSERYCEIAANQLSQGSLFGVSA